MSYLFSILMGILQGVTEFLPVSSSGHLTLFQYFFGQDPESTDMLFTILLHFGTLISVCVYYWRDVLGMIREFFLGLAAIFSRKGTTGRPPEARRLVLMVIVATLPLFAVLLVKDWLDAAFSNVTFVSLALIATGFILFFSDRMAKGHKHARTATMKDALIVGCVQAVATLPGLSRAGTTISAGMMVGFDRTFAVRFSFLMSLPAVLGANILEVVDAAASASPPVSLDTALPAAYNKHRKRALRQAVGPKSVEVSYEEETVTCRGGGFCVLLQS